MERLQQDNEELKLEADEVEAENVALQQQVERMREEHERDRREMMDEMERLHASVAKASGSEKKAMAGGKPPKEASRECPLDEKNTTDGRQSLQELDLERAEFQQSMDAAQLSLLNNVPDQNAVRLNRPKQRRNVRDAAGDPMDSSFTTWNATPHGYHRVTESDPDIFVRRPMSQQFGNITQVEAPIRQLKSFRLGVPNQSTPDMEILRRENDRLKEKLAGLDPGKASEKRRDPKQTKREEEADHTESAESEEEEDERRSRGPWPLQREECVKGSGEFQKRVKQSTQRQVTVEMFTGEIPLQEYLGQFEAAATWNGWTEAQRAQQLFMSLRGRARGVIRHQDEWKVITYQDIVSRLKSMFAGQAELYLAQLRGRQQQPQESLQDFAQSIMKLTDNAYAEMVDTARNRIARDHFMSNIREREVRSAVHLSRPVTMEVALQTALETEAFLSTEKQRYGSPAKYTRVVGYGEATNDAPMMELMAKVDRLIEEANTRQDNTRRSSVNNQQLLQGSSSKGGRGCYRCGKEGHFISDCQMPDTRVCYLCKKRGHSLAVCPMLEKMQSTLHSGNEKRPNQGTGEGSSHE